MFEPSADDFSQGGSTEPRPLPRELLLVSSRKQELVSDGRELLVKEVRRAERPVGCLACRLPTVQALVDDARPCVSPSPNAVV